MSKRQVSDADLLALAMELGNGPMRPVAGWTHGLPVGYRQMLLSVVQELAARRLNAAEDLEDDIDD